MKIADLITEKGNKVYTVKKDTCAYDAVATLDEHKIGAVIVLDKENNVAGILSERDILYKCYKSGIPLKEQTVNNLMTNVEDILIGKLDDTPQELMQIMVNKKIRHIPVIDKETIVGIVSIGDLLKTVLDNYETESHLLKEYIKNPFGVHIYNKD